MTQTPAKPLRCLAKGDQLELANGTPVVFVKMYSAHDGQAAVVTLDYPADLRHGERMKLRAGAELFERSADL